MFTLPGWLFGLKKTKENMSHDENTKYLENAYQLAEQAVVDNDYPKLAEVFLDLEEKGFTSEADKLRAEFDTLNE